MTEGNVIDHAAIKDTVLAAAARYDLKALAFDPWNCETTAQQLAADGVSVFKFNQNLKSFNEPARAFERAVLGGRLLHGGNPVLRWMASNCVTLTNGAGCIMPSRKKSRDKIDGVVASVMAVGCHLKADATDGPSVYETHGVD
jgi:phage terminase large subunit-like protein